MSPVAPDVPIAYYWGDDLHALEVAATAFAGRLGDPVAPPEAWRVRGDAVTLDEIAERIGTAPLFGGGTVVVVAEPAPLARSKEARASLAAILGSVAPGNGLVFLESVDGSGRRPAALDHLRADVAAAGGETREFKAPREGQLTGWIEARARERGLHLAPGAAKTLAERIGGFVREGDVDRRRQSQVAMAELEKLALYRPGGEVSATDVEALVPEVVPGSTWAFLDAIAERRARVASQLLERLAETTAEPVLVVMLHRRLRELLEVAERLERGETPGSLVRSMKLKEFRAKNLAVAARAWRPDELVAALEGLLELELAVKGADRAPSTEAQRRLRFTLWIAERVAPSRR